MYLVAKPSEKINQGYPLSSITFIPEFNKYSIDLTEEEKNIKKYNGEVIDFIINNI